MDRALVVPGEELGTAEEYEASGYAYSSDYKVLSSAIGVARFNRLLHVVHVTPLKQPHYPTFNDVVRCVVVSITGRAAVLRCFAVEKGESVMYLKYPVTGMIPSIFSGEHNIEDAVGIGDIIRGRVVSRKGPPFTVSISGFAFGVISAMCPRCRKRMRRRGNYLYCPSCGMSIKRKVSILYV